MRRILMTAALMAGCGNDGIQPPSSHCSDNASIGTTTADYCTGDCFFDSSATPSTNDCPAHVESAAGGGDTACVGTYLVPRGSAYVMGCCVPVRNDERHSIDWYFAECE